MRRIVPLLSFCLLAAACGDDDDASDPGAIDELAGRLLAARCEAEVACHAYPDRASCEAATRQSVEDTKALVASGKVVFHAEHADACVAEVGLLFSCSAGDRLVAAQDGLDDCQALFEGQLAEGEVCHAGEECASKRCAKPSSCQNAQCCAGTCGAPEVLAAIGASCAAASCEKGAYCQRDVDGNRTTCAARVADGQACTGFDACQAPSVCADGMCRRLPGDGETCSATVPCDGLDQRCSAEGTCVALARLGQDCVVDEVTGHDCVANAYCADGVCKANPGAGQACETAGPDCQGDLDCTGGTCSLAPDEACQVSAT